jgi:hypothetical protein
MSYEEFGLDILLSDKDWKIIHPDMDGILCANCVVKRASKIDNVLIVEMKLSRWEDR